MPIYIPQAYGVPGLNGPPHWWDDSTGPAPTLNSSLEDPRWVGATAHGFPMVVAGQGGGQGEHVLFRALHDNSALYLSWLVKIDDSGLKPEKDALYVGFKYGSGANDHVILEIKLTDGSAQQASDKVVGQVFRRLSKPGQIDDGAESLIDATPGWLQLTGWWCRAWVTPSTDVRWALALRIPISTSGKLSEGLPLGNQFKMWYEIQTFQPNVGSSGVFLVYNWPISPVPVHDIKQPDPQTGVIRRITIFPDPQGWDDAQLGSGPPTFGVSLSPTDIGTKNNPPHIIKVDLSNNKPPMAIENVFVARPMNNTGFDIPAKSITARFRLANWGSQVDWGKPPAGEELWQTIRGGEAVEQEAIMAAGKNGEISFSWKVGENPHEQEAYDFRGDPNDPDPTKRPKKRLHQCMLVELHGPVEFANTSVYRNMDFDHASVVQNDAVQISVAGLRPLPDTTHRDIYLFVEKRNMPRRIKVAKRENIARWGQHKALMDELIRLNGGSFNTIVWRNFISRFRPGSNRFPSRIGRRLLKGQELQAAEWARMRPFMKELNFEAALVRRRSAAAIPELKSPAIDTLTRHTPTFRVHVFHDTGKLRSVGGRDCPILEAQTSFGYMLGFNEGVRGWSHWIDGPGHTYFKGTKGRWFKIPVPNNGSTSIRVKIIAKD